MNANDTPRRSINSLRRCLQLAAHHRVVAAMPLVRICISGRRSLRSVRFWTIFLFFSIALVILQATVLKDNLRRETRDEPMKNCSVSHVSIDTKDTESGTEESLNDVKHIEQTAQPLMETDVSQDETRLTTRRLDITYTDRERARRHQLAMHMLLPFKYIHTYPERLFRIIERFNGQKYTKLMDMFDQLILDQWTFYKTNDTMNKQRWSTWDEDKGPPKHEINCTNIHQISIKTRLGEGYIKVGFEGDFFGRKVVVKVKNMKTTRFRGVCGWENFTCAVYRDIRIMNELLIMDHMEHPMFIRVLGYCIHSGLGTADFMEEPGVIGVYEMGRPAKSEMITNWDWKQSLNQAAQFADFLNYVEHSPLGRLTLYDMESWQFLYARSHICLTDMDLADNMPDPLCNDVLTHPVETEKGINVTACHFSHPFALGYVFDIQCIDGRCLHKGQKHNMMKLNGILRRLLYWRRYPEHMHIDMRELSDLVQNYLPAAVLYDKLKWLVDNNLIAGSMRSLEESK